MFPQNHLSSRQKCDSEKWRGAGGDGDAIGLCPLSLSRALEAEQPETKPVSSSWELPNLQPLSSMPRGSDRGFEGSRAGTGFCS